MTIKLWESATIQKLSQLLSATDNHTNKILKNILADIQ